MHMMERTMGVSDDKGYESFRVRVDKSRTTVVWNKKIMADSANAVRAGWASAAPCSRRGREAGRRGREADAGARQTRPSNKGGFAERRH